MTAMFPDSGVPYTDARNSLPSPLVQGNCNPLWYSTSRCQPRFDPAAANAVLAELINLANKPNYSYDCTKLNNIELAVRYLIQHGLPNVAIAFDQGTGQHYLGVFDPPIRYYNNGMVLCITPNTTNVGAVSFRAADQLYGFILRNDGLHLEAGDLKAGIPVLIMRWDNNWYICGLVASQTSQVMNSDVDGWVRPDGNDSTGDGTANTPQKAFRTINGAWAKLGKRYIASPMFGINIRLGVPGSYEGGLLQTFGGLVRIIGDVNNSYNYVVNSVQYSDMACCLRLGHIACEISGVNARLNAPGVGMQFAGSATILLHNCWCEQNVNSPQTGFLWVINASTVSFWGGTMSWKGNGTPMLYGWLVQNSSQVGTARADMPVTHNFVNCPFNSAGFSLGTNSMIGFPSATIGGGGNSGPHYNVTGNAVLGLNGQSIPGCSAGSVGSGGQVV